MDPGVRGLVVILGVGDVAGVEGTNGRNDYLEFKNPILGAVIFHVLSWQYLLKA